jgi:hypothetical protein
MDNIEDMLQSHPMNKANKIAYLKLQVQQASLHKKAWTKGEPRPLAVKFLVWAQDK